MTADKDTIEGRSGDDVAEIAAIAAIAAILRDTPFHRWPQLRALGSEARHAAFDQATVQVKAGWTKDEQHAHVRGALTAAAAEIILALPDWDAGEPVLVEHLRSASAALQAVGELTPGLDARSAA